MGKGIWWFLVIANFILMIYWGVNIYLESRKPFYMPGYWEEGKMFIMKDMRINDQRN